MNPIENKQKFSNTPLVLVDGSSYLYRAFHAMPALMNAKGFPTGAIYGVINMLRRLLKDHSPERIAVVFDAKGKTFRDDLFPAYKATRKAMPDELVLQIEPLHTLIKSLGIPILVEAGVEADDVIGTLAKAAEKQGIDTLISTGDKDIAQLVSEHITLVNTMTDTWLTPDSVVEKFGVAPAQIIDYLTLVGDTSDNIPGITGVGPKTAVKWLNTFGSLDNLMAHAAEVTGKVGDNLRAGLGQIPLSRTLTTIRTDIALPVKIEELKPQPADTEQLKKLFQEFEFKNWLNELLQQAPAASSPSTQTYETILTEKQLDQWISALQKADCYAVDTETTALDPVRAELVGLSFAVADGKAAYLPLGHVGPSVPMQLDRAATLQTLRSVLEDKTPKKIGHHLKYDLTVLKRAGIALDGILADTMIESTVLDSGSNRHDMDSLALKHLGRRTITFEDVAGKGAKQITFDHVPVDKASQYAAEDADVTLALHQLFWSRLAAESSLKKVFTDIEMPLVPVLARMEQCGVRVDPDKLLQQTDELEKRLADIEKAAFALTGGSFNLNSPKQLQEILFEKMQLPVLQKTPTGQPSTAEAVLAELADDYELPRLIIEHRTFSKLVSTYTRRLPEQINPETGRIHTSWHQLGAATGRLSSSEPNLQNIPIRTKEGRRIREAFVAPEGYCLISADYSQIELRIMAHISEDPVLLKAFAEGQDIHRATAAEILGIPPDTVSSEERRAAKAVNFGLIYGMSAFGLAKQLGTSRETAQDYIERYFARYPGVAAYMEKTREKARALGYVETLWGRRLYLPEIHSSQIMRKKAAERTAINAPLQGSAADIIKMAMISLDRWIQDTKPDARIIMQVHDELVLEAAIDKADAIKEQVRSHMMHAATLKVPLEVSMDAGPNWDAASGK